MADTAVVSGKFKAYVVLVAVLGASLAFGLAATVNSAQVRQDALTVALFAAFLLVSELVVVPIRHRGEVRELTVTNTFAFALVVLAGTAVGVVALAVSSVAADLIRRKAPYKVWFNLGQWAISLGAGGSAYAVLGGGQRISAAGLPALLLGGAVFLLVNHLLVGGVVSLASGTPLLRGLVADLRVELGTSAMLLALAPIAVLTAQQALVLVPALLLPIVAVHLSSKGELQALQRRAEAEAIAQQQRELAVQAEAAAERQRRLTRQEQELVRHLQEADRMKQDLIATVTHELRSPLTTIVGTYTMLERRDGQLDAAGRTELIRMGVRQSERLKRMIEQLLLAARFQDGVTPLPLAHDDADATALVRQACAEAQARHPDRPILVEADGPLPVRVATDAIVQVLGNLIDNASKYSPDGGPIRVIAMPRDGTAVLAVEDAGPGIAADDRQQVFERFTQLDSSTTRRAGGVGLGLYIARQLARSQDGDLIVTDSSGPHGARFEFHLPLLRQAVGS
jgi:signal transduction histidine kinase